MSRYFFVASERALSFGYDYAFGYFIQVWAGDERPEIDLDSSFDGLTHGQLLEALVELGLPETGPISVVQPHRDVFSRGGYASLEVVRGRIALDLPI